MAVGGWGESQGSISPALFALESAMCGFLCTSNHGAELLHGTIVGYERGERGEGGPPPCAAPARCCPRAASRPFLPSNRTHPRAPTHTYSALRTHLFTLNSAENRRTRTPSRRAPATSVGNPPVPNPGGRARPRATSTLHNTSSARRRRHSPPRTRCLPTRASRTGTRILLSLSRGCYTHKL